MDRVGASRSRQGPRVARFEGDPADVDARVERLRSMLESGGMPPELAGAKILLMVDRASGGALGVTLFESEEAMRRGDGVMNAGQGYAGARSYTTWSPGSTRSASSAAALPPTEAQGSSTG